MSFCCNNPGNLGCYPSCGDIRTGLFVESEGWYNIHVSVFGTTRIVSVYLEAGQEVIIPGPINESALYKFVVYNSDAEVVTLGGYDCYKFTTYLAEGSNVRPPLCADPDCAFGRSLVYRNYVSYMTLGGLDTHLLTLIADFVCDDPGAIMTVDWGDGSPVEIITPMTPATHGTVNTPGHFIGTIHVYGSQGAAYMNFYYQLVDSGEVHNTSYLRQTQIGVLTPCSYYPEYAVNVHDVFGADKDLFKSYKIVILGDDALQQSTNGVYNDLSNTVATNFNPASGTLVMSIDTDHGPLASSATLVTQCNPAPNP